MIANCNILNNKRKNSSFSVQILSIFTFSRRKRASFSHNPHHNDMIISHFSNSSSLNNYKLPKTDSAIWDKWYSKKNKWQSKWHQKLKNETLCTWIKLLEWLYGVQQTTAWEKKNNMVYHTYERPTFLFFWEAKRVSFDMSKSTEQKVDGYKETHNICK